MVFLISYCDKSGAIRTHRTKDYAKAYDFAITCSRPVNMTIWFDTAIPNYNIPRNYICESKDAIATAFASINSEYMKSARGEMNA